MTIGFSRTLTGLPRERTKRGEINSVETTRLTETKTCHDFLVHGDLLQVSLYGLQGRDSVWFHSRLLVERSNIHHARVKAKLVIIKAVQGTCLRTNWCEVLLLQNLKIKRADTINSRPLKIGHLGSNSQLWYRKYTYLNYSRTAQEIETEN